MSSYEDDTDITGKPKIIVLWTRPLIEIIDTQIYIDDVLVWSNGKLVHRDD